jgi:hypothetical protein
LVKGNASVEMARCNTDGAEKAHWFRKLNERGSLGIRENDAVRAPQIDPQARHIIRWNDGFTQPPLLAAGCRLRFTSIRCRLWQAGAYWGVREEHSPRRFFEQRRFYSPSTPKPRALGDQPALSVHQRAKEASIGILQGAHTNGVLSWHYNFKHGNVPPVRNTLRRAPRPQRHQPPVRSG